MNDQQPDALRLAECIDFPSVHLGHEAAAELRRLHEENAQLRSANAYAADVLHPMGDRIAAQQAVMQQALEAIDLGLSYAQAELARRREAFEGYPNRYSTELADVARLERDFAALREQLGDTQ